jgi:peroxiredoxin
MAASFLKNGDLFPDITANAVTGGTILIPEYLDGWYGVVLLYRGAWCPYCNTQLAAFARAQDSLAELGARIVALSVDDAPTSAATVAKYGIRFLVGHSANIDCIAAATGAYVSEDPKHFQSTGFVLDRAGRVITAVYSSGAIGRLLPDDVAGFIRYLVSHT